jgi:hypothetical protein
MQLPFVLRRLLLFMSIAAAFAADKEAAKFEVRPVTEYKARQSNSKVTIAAQAFVSDDETRAPFNKVNPYKYGILPILVVIQNDSDQAISVEHLNVEYVTADHQRIFNTPARDVRFVNSGDKPNVNVGPAGPKLGRQKKNPLADWTIEGRAFAARMIPAGQSASGFFYFQTGYLRSASLVLDGLKDARSGADLFYFEIPLADALK